MNKFFPKKSIEIAVILTIFTIVSSVIKNENTQDPVWFVSYLSGAVNLDSDNVWRYSLEELNEIRQNEKQDIIYSYDFQKYPKEDLIENKYNAIGYLYIVKFVSLFMPFLPLVRALQVFQLFLHVLLSFTIYYTFRNSKQKLLFLVLYFINPVIIYLASFPYYYFYQVIPSFIIILLLKKRLNLVLLILFFGIQGLLINVRMTMLFAVVISFVLLVIKYDLKSIILSIISVSHLYV